MRTTSQNDTRYAIPGAGAIVGNSMHVASVTAARQVQDAGALAVVAKDVPAMVCASRGEERLDAPTTEQVLRMAEEAAAAA